MNLVENFKIVEALKPQTNGGDLTGDYINMENANHVTVLVHVAQATSATAKITLEQATVVAGTDSKVIAKEVPIYLVADTATSDSWVAQTDAVEYTTSAAVKNKLVAFEVDAEDLDIANGFKCLVVKVGTSHASTLVSAVYICGKLRFGATKTLITD